MAVRERELLRNVRVSSLVAPPQEVAQLEVCLPLRTAELDDMDVMGAYEWS